MTDHDDIKELIERWAAAVRDGDMAGVLAHHTDDVVMYDVPPPVESRGLAAYEATWELFYKFSPGGDGSFDLGRLEISASDSVAYCHTLVNVVGNRVRLTIGLRKVDGRWMIAHEHHSYPSG